MTKVTNRLPMAIILGMVVGVLILPPGILPSKFQGVAYAFCIIGRDAPELGPGQTQPLLDSDCDGIPDMSDPCPDRPDNSCLGDDLYPFPNTPQPVSCEWLRENAEFHERAAIGLAVGGLILFWIPPVMIAAGISALIIGLSGEGYEDLWEEHCVNRPSSS